MVDNIFVKIHKNEREIRNFQRDSTIIEKRILPLFEKIKVLTEPTEIVRELKSIARATKRMSWSSGAIKTSSTNFLPWNYFEHLHVFDEKTIVRYAEELKNNDNLDVVIGSLKKCLSYSTTQIKELMEKNQFLRSKASHYPAIEQLNSDLENEINFCKKAVVSLEQEKKYGKSSIQFIEELGKQLQNEDLILEPQVLITILEESKKSIDAFNEVDPAITESVKKLDSLILRITLAVAPADIPAPAAATAPVPEKATAKTIASVKEKLTVKELTKLLSLEFNNNYQCFTRLSKKPVEIKKRQEYQKALEKLKANFDDLRKFVYLGQESTDIELRIVNMLALINEDIRALSTFNHNPALIDNIINCLTMTLAPNESKLFSSESIQFQKILQNIIDHTTEHPKGGIKMLAGMSTELFIANKVFKGEFKKLSALLIKNLKEELKNLGIGHRNQTEINNELVDSFKSNTKEDFDKLKLFILCLNELPDKAILCKQLMAYLLIINKIIDPASPLSHTSLLAICQESVKFGEIKVIEDTNKLNDDLTPEILNKYKNRITGMFSSVKKLNIDQIDLKTYKDALCILEKMKVHYTDFNVSAIEDDQFNTSRDLCEKIYAQCIAIASEYAIYKSARSSIDNLIAHMNLLKHEVLRYMGDQFLSKGEPCTLFQIFTIANNSQNWNFASLEEFKANVDAVQLRTDINKKYFSGSNKKIDLPELECTYQRFTSRITEIIDIAEQLKLDAKNAETTKKKNTKNSVMSADSFFNESNLLKEIRKAETIFQNVKSQLKEASPSTPNEILKQAHNQKLIEYALMLADKIINVPPSSLKTDYAIKINRLAILRCISVLGETFNSMQEELKTTDYPYQMMIALRNKLQHSATTKNGPDELREFLQTGKCESKKAEVVGQDNKPKDIYFIYSPLKTIKSILKQIEFVKNIMEDAHSNEVDPELKKLALEHMTTFIGGDLVTRLESNQIFLDNFNGVNIDDDRIDDIADVNLGAMFVVLEQVRMYRNDLAHAHMAIANTQENQINSHSDLEKKLRAVTFDIKKIKVRDFSPEQLLMDRFKSTLQLCWAIMMLTDKNRNLKDDLEKVIEIKLNEFEEYLDVKSTPESDLDMRKKSVIIKLNDLIRLYGNPHLPGKMASLKTTESYAEGSLLKKTDGGDKLTKSHFNVEGSNLISDRFGLFKQYYNNIRDCQLKLEIEEGHTRSLIKVN